MKVIFIVSSIYGVERLGVQILTSIAKEEGFDTFFYSLDSIQEGSLFHRISDIKPDIIAYSAMTYEHYRIYSFNKKLKEKFSFISIFGGPHHTFNPEEINCNEHIDIICVGEGENAFRSFLKHIKEKMDYTKINNLIVRHNNIIYRNSVGPLMNNLDEVPFADRKIISLCSRGGVFYYRKGLLHHDFKRMSVSLHILF